METWGPVQRALAGVRIAAGLGALAGALEAVALAARLKLSLGFFGFFLLGVTAAALMACVGAGFGALLAPVQVLLRNAWASTALTLHAAATAFLLCGFYLWQGAWVLRADGQDVPAAAMALMPFFFAGVTYFNARYFLRRAEAGHEGLSWPLTAGLGALGLIGVAAGSFAMRDTGGASALDGDRNVVFVAVNGWPVPDAPGPGLKAVIDAGVSFTQAVTPDPSVRSANATLLTGLHPLRHEVLFDEDPLAWGYTSVAELLEKEGYATGAFVSDPALDADSGLEQGFRVYDDDRAPIVGGLLRVNLIKWFAGGRGSPRSGSATLDRFEGWLDAKAGVPFFAWVQLPAGSDPDVLLARVDAALADAGVADETLLIALGTRGEARSHGLSGDQGLYDDLIRVPLALRAPGMARTVPEVAHQVRLMDVPGTAVTWLGLDPLVAEGVDLLDYAAGRREATVWSALIGRSGDDVLIGLRNNGVKYVLDRGTGQESLFHVLTDPGELTDLKQSQPDTLTSARFLLGADARRLDQLLGSAPAGPP